VRYILKVLIWPVIMVLSLMQVLLKGVTKAYCLVAGIAINLLIICSLLAVFSRQWFALGVFAVLFVVLIAVLMCAGTITVILDGLKERLLEV